jgi:hypothetical protein
VGLGYPSYLPGSGNLLANQKNINLIKLKLNIIIKEVKLNEKIFRKVFPGNCENAKFGNTFFL